MKRERRKIKLINPGLQLRIVGVFAGASALSFLLQGLFIASRMSEQRLVEASGSGRTTNIWIELLVLSVGLFLPLTIAIGILLTHRIAGPAYRIEQHLRAILRGEEVRPCKLRDGDEFKELCTLVNQTVEHLSQRAQETDGDSDGDSAEDRRKSFRAVS